MQGQLFSLLLPDFNHWERGVRIPWMCKHIYSSQKDEPVVSYAAAHVVAAFIFNTI